MCIRWTKKRVVGQFELYISVGVIPKNPRFYQRGARDLPWHTASWGRSFAPPEERLRSG